MGLVAATFGLYSARMKKPLLLLLRPRLPARPFRLWMTGSFAVVMAAMLPLRDAAASDRGNGLRSLRHSRYSVTETVQRIETAAISRGLTVLALLEGKQPVLVLASSVGGTPVVMTHADSKPTMPLGLLVRESTDGGADVFLFEGSDELDDSHGVDNTAASRWDDLPEAVADDMQALPALVAQALA
jgi:hypothetical protein